MGIGMRELLVILVIALVVFGAKRVRTLGSDLGSALRGFKQAMAEEEEIKASLEQAPNGTDKSKQSANLEKDTAAT
jgi:sec-independent protein translocase protein TatA